MWKKKNVRVELQERIERQKYGSNLNRKNYKVPSVPGKQSQTFYETQKMV